MLPKETQLGNLSKLSLGLSEKTSGQTISLKKGYVGGLASSNVLVLSTVRNYFFPNSPNQLNLEQI